MQYKIDVSLIPEFISSHGVAFEILGGGLNPYYHKIKKVHDRYG